MKHPDLQDSASCIHCGAIVKCNKGTGGLSGHMQYRHRELYTATEEGVAASSLSTVKSSVDTDKTQSKIPFSKQPTTAELKRIFKARAVYFCIEQSIPFTLFDKPSFRAMLEPFHPDAPKIVKAANSKSIREGVLRLGELAKEATKLEMKNHRGSWTTDHWTGPKNETYTTTTFHYIDNWSMRSAILDFSVYSGRTTGERIFENQKAVLESYDDKPFVVMCVTDTTGNMGSLGAKLREDGMEHGYCTDHNFARTAILAYDGKIYVHVHFNIMHRCLTLTFHVN